MKWTLKIEELAFFALALYIYPSLGYSWGLFALLLLTPDLSALGYLANPRLGAFTYNLVHHRALALLLFYFGYINESSVILLIAVILFAHSSMDRLFAYGFKFSDSFQNTHLGPIGKSAKS